MTLPVNYGNGTWESLAPGVGLSGGPSSGQLLGFFQGLPAPSYPWGGTFSLRGPPWPRQPGPSCGPPGSPQAGGPL